MDKEQFEAKRQRRIERLEAKAEKARQASEAAYNESHRIAQRVPLGQPILIGHHSEKRMRAHYDKVGRLMDKSCIEAKKAELYQQRAEAAEDNTSISSDDPEAIEKLTAKLEYMEKQRDTMKTANKIIRSNPKNVRTDEKINKLISLGIRQENAENSFIPDFANRIGYAPYCLQNLGANIKRVKERIESLRASKSRQTKTVKKDGFSIIYNAEENRIQIDFDSKEDYFRLCKDKGINLKREGWNYSRYNNLWQRQWNGNSLYRLEWLLEKIAI